MVTSRMFQAGYTVEDINRVSDGYSPHRFRPTRGATGGWCAIFGPERQVDATRMVQS